MKQLMPFYACRKAWVLAYQDKLCSNPDRIWIVMGRTGIEMHIGTSEKYLDDEGKVNIRHKAKKFITEYII